MNTKLKAWKEEKILGMPLWLAGILTVLLMFLACKDWLLTNVIGCLAFAMVVGSVLGWIGNKIPIWNTWLGGGMLFACLGAGALNTFGLIGEETISALNTFNGTTGFLDLYIVCLITGSVLAVDRKILVKSLGAYIPVIIGGIIGALSLAALVGLITGVGSISALIDYAIPIMGGGNGAGIQPMSKMWAAATGEDSSSWYATRFAIISLANLVAVFFCAILNRVGKKYPSLTGNGRLMRSSEDIKEEKKEEVKPTVADYATGLAVAVSCYCLANLYSSHISIINNVLDLGFTVHAYAFMVIFMTIINVANILPDNVKAGCRGIQQFFVKYMSFPLMITVGIGTDLSDYAAVFTNPAYLLIIVATVVGAVIGTFLFSLLFKMYPIEGIITAGMCMANGGGSGDVQCLAVSDRMDMMPYAQISSRIGGAIMLVIASFFMGRFL